MKKTFTLRSVCAAIAICFGLTANAQTPTVLSAADVTASHVGQLVQIDEVMCNAYMGATIAAGETINLMAGVTQVGLQVGEGSELIGVSLPGEYASFSVVGIVKSFDETWSFGAEGCKFIIEPRTEADIILPEPAPYVEISSTRPPESVYLGESFTVTLMFYVENLKGDVTLSGLSNQDTEATFNFSQETITKEELEAGEVDVTVTITPKVQSMNPNMGTWYNISYETEGVEYPESLSINVVVEAKEAKLTFEVEDNNSTVYVGEEYEVTLFVKGNEFVTNKVTLEVAENSDIVSLSKYELTAEEVKAVNKETNYLIGAPVTVTIKPSAKGFQDYSLFLTIKTVDANAGEKTFIAEDLYFSDVKAASPEIEISGSYTQATKGEAFTTTITITANQYTVNDITLSKYSESDNIVFETTTVSAAAAKAEGGATVQVTITPTESGSPKFFYISATTTDKDGKAIVIEKAGSVRVGEVITTEPVISALKVENEGYILRDATVGQPFAVTVTVNGTNLTHNITFSSDDSQFTSFAPEEVTPAEAAAGKDVVVTITPTKVSADEYDKQSFTFKASSEGAADLKQTIEFVVLSAGTGTAIENVETEVKAVKVMENGQIFILKDGVKYNVLGTIVK